MLPDINQLHKLEKDTLQFIAQSNAFSNLILLKSSAEIALRDLTSSRSAVNVHLGFTLDIRLRSDVKKQICHRRVDIGALVEPCPAKKTVRNASYSLIICRNENAEKSPIIRKLHFDYEPVLYRSSEAKPTTHMQVGGKLSPHHHKLGYSEVRLKSLYPEFEKPRVPLPPVSLAILLNWIFLEFQTDSTAARVLKEPEWRKLVAKAERMILLPYYQDATKFLTSATNKESRFYQGYLYELNNH